MMCDETFTYMIMGRKWPLVSSLLVSFPPSLGAASQILLRNYFCSASQSVWFLRGGFSFRSNCKPSSQAWPTRVLHHHDHRACFGDSHMTHVKPMGVSSGTFAGTIKEEKLFFLVGVARLEGWSKEFVVSIWQPRGKAFQGAVAVWKKAKTSDV